MTDRSMQLSLFLVSSTANVECPAHAPPADVPDDQIPDGFVRGRLAGTISPTFGRHAGTCMTPDSAFAECLKAGRR